MIAFLAVFFWLGLVVPSYALNIAVVKSRDIEAYNLALEGFKEILTQSLPGQKVDFWIAASLNGEKELSPEVIDNIRAKEPVLILTLGTVATTVVQREFQDIPIVFSMVFNPVASGLVKSMRSSDKNLTGSSLNIPIKTQFSQLKSVVAGLRRIGVIYNLRENRELIQEAFQTARDMGLELVPVMVNSDKEIPHALERLIRKIDALWAVSDSIVFNPKSTQYILRDTLKNEVPFMGLSPSYVKAGALFALSCDYKDIGRQSGELATRIIGGEDLSNIYITIPREVLLSINLTVAKQIGLRVPSTVIARAKKIFK